MKIIKAERERSIVIWVIASKTDPAPKDSQSSYYHETRWQRRTEWQCMRTDSNVHYDSYCTPLLLLMTGWLQGSIDAASEALSPLSFFPWWIQEQLHREEFQLLKHQISLDEIVQFPDSAANMDLFIITRQTRYPEARRFNRCLLCLRETTSHKLLTELHFCVWRSNQAYML
jgi:hypothetical protein